MPIPKKMSKKSLVAEMDRSIKRMLNLIEGEGDSFAKKADMYYQKRPELISHVEEFYRMYRSLAERYDHLTGELRKNIPSELQSQGSGISESGSDMPPALPRSTRKSARRRAAGFDFFLGSGGVSSDISQKEGNDSSSSSSDSESLSDSASSINNYVGIPASGDAEGLRRKIIELEVDLRNMKEELCAVKEGHSNGVMEATGNTNYEELLNRVKWYEEELKVADEKLRISEGVIARLKLESVEPTDNMKSQLESAGKVVEMREAELELEKRRVVELQEQIAELETNVSDPDGRIVALVEERRITNKKLQDKEEEVATLKLELKIHERQVAGLESENIPVIEPLEGITRFEADMDQDSKIKALEEELRVARKRLQDSEKEIARFKYELENNASSEATTNLQVQLESEKKRILELEEQIIRYKSDISDLDSEIKELEVAFSVANQNFSVEKSQLEAKVSRLSEERVLLETKLKEWEARGSCLEEEIKLAEETKVMLEAREMGIDGDFGLLKLEIKEKGDRVEELNKRLDELKLKHDMLLAERDNLDAKILELTVNVSSRDNQIHQMDGHLHKLHIEHVELIAGSEVARKQVEELQSRAEELEEEVKRQRVVISDGAEEKREAIRQLCFSLEHYRDGYHQLRQAFLGNKRVTVMAT